MNEINMKDSDESMIFESWLGELSSELVNLTLEHTEHR